MEEISREELIKQIYELMGLETNLDSFQYDDLVATRDDLLAQKENIREDINKWFDEELFEKLT